jgi:hypothetical protein
MPAVIRSTCTIQNQNGVPRDAVTNAFVFAITGTFTGSADAHLNAIRDAIENFYITQSSGQGHPLDYYLGKQLSRVANTATIKHYDISTHLDGTPAGSPLKTDTFAIRDSGSAVQLPDEVCVAVSFTAVVANQLVTGPTVSTLPTEDKAVDEGAPATHSGHERPRSRRTGRIFFGPLDAVSHDVTGNGSRPSTDFRTDLTVAAKKLATPFGTGADTHLSVWSRRDGAVSPVLGGFVDDRWDSQRRRRPAPSQRTSWSL